MEALFHSYSFLVAAGTIVSAAIHFIQGCRLYKANTTVIQRAYLGILFHGVESKMNELEKHAAEMGTVDSGASLDVKSSAPVNKIAPHIFTTANVDAEASKHPAIKAAMKGDYSQLNADIKSAVKMRYVGRGMTAKGG